jgi:hypothetical protein
MTDQTTPAGAMPAEAGATPTQTTPVSPALEPNAATTTPATGDTTDALGDAGKKAIAAERKAAKEAQDALKAAQAELGALKAAGLSESEKAIKEASDAATAAERAKWQTSIRAVRVESALRVAGATNETLLELALRSDVIAALKVDEDGKVADLDKAVEQLKKDIPEMFTPAGAGAPTRGAQPGLPPRAKDLESAIGAHYSKH